MKSLEQLWHLFKTIKLVIHLYCLSALVIKSTI